MMRGYTTDYVNLIESSGIPFELFQNADDAAVELGQFRAHPSEGCKVPEAAQHFVVEYWGRPINARGPVGFGGERRGYDRDRRPAETDARLGTPAAAEPRDVQERR